MDMTKTAFISPDDLEKERQDAWEKAYTEVLKCIHHQLNAEFDAKLNNLVVIKSSIILRRTAILLPPEHWKEVITRVRNAGWKVTVKYGKVSSEETIIKICKK
jgi:hypothetical protein